MAHDILSCSLLHCAKGYSSPGWWRVVVKFKKHLKCQTAAAFSIVRVEGARATAKVGLAEPIGREVSDLPTGDQIRPAEGKAAVDQACQGRCNLHRSAVISCRRGEQVPR